MIASAVIVFPAAIVSYFSLIFFCHFQSKNDPIATWTNMINNCTAQQLCVQFYTIDLIMYAVNCISTNLSTLIITLAFGLSTYGWLVAPAQMRESIVDIYKEMKTTTTAIVTELWASGHGAVRSVWESLSVIKTIEFAFRLLLLISVPDFIDYLKKAVIRFAKLS
jgi:hypothetical protein